jgi:hypothetical protein
VEEEVDQRERMDRMARVSHSPKKGPPYPPGTPWVIPLIPYWHNRSTCPAPAEITPFLNHTPASYPGKHWMCPASGVVIAHAQEHIKKALKTHD